MLLSDVSVKRPVFATVINLLLIIFGIFFFLRMPLREYPDVDPPVVSIETRYPGAAAAVVESRITQIVEDAVSGVEGIETIESVSRDGQSAVTIEFNIKRDIDAAANDIRDRVSRVQGDLPSEIDPPEISKVDANAQPILWMRFMSNSRDALELTDYADRYLVDRLSVVEGVARVIIGGEQRYAMRIWLDRMAMNARDVTVTDVEEALRRENVELPAGRIESNTREFSVRIARTFTTADDFQNLVIRTAKDGYQIRLADIAKVELGPEDERRQLRANGQPTIGLGVVKQSRANTLAVAENIKIALADITKTLPSDMTLEVLFDSSVFISEAVDEVYETFVMAVLLVVGIIYLFLGSARATVVPAVTIPVSVIASFSVLHWLGFSVNLLTLLSLILAIGLVVDDAIVVLENIYAKIEQGVPPLLAAYEGTRQVGFAVIATTLVLLAVFIPISFLEGTVGRLFTEFSLAMATAVSFSSLVALTLCPVICSLVLRKTGEPSSFVRLINASMDWLSLKYAKFVRAITDRWKVGLLVLSAVLASIGVLYTSLAREFAPTEDRGVIYLIINAPEGASVSYMVDNLTRLETSVSEIKDSLGITSTLMIMPRNFGSTAAVNSAIGIVNLKPKGEREFTASTIVKQLYGRFAAFEGIQIFPILPQGIGSRSFSQPVQVVLSGPTYDALSEWQKTVLEKLSESKSVTAVNTDYKPTKPQLLLEVDHKEAADLGISMRNIGQTLETFLGSRKVTTYFENGEEYDVIVEGRKEDRSSISDLDSLYLRSDRSGTLVPISNFVSVSDQADAAELNRFNRLRSVTISGNPASGASLGTALEEVTATIRDVLPGNALISYKGESREFEKTGSSIMQVFLLALIVIYLVLAAQFESFLQPLIILAAVPAGVLGALLGLWLVGDTLNIYSQIGIIMIVGLAAKNSILIVEFANQLRDEGMGLGPAIWKACQDRLRPILMTTISTAVGAIPLIYSSGAGSESRLSLGTVIFFGTIISAGFSLFITPIAYWVIAPMTGSPEARAKELRQLQPTE